MAGTTPKKGNVCHEDQGERRDGGESLHSTPMNQREWEEAGQGQLWRAVVHSTHGSGCTGPGILGGGHLPTVPPPSGRLQPPRHGTGRALLRLLGRRTQVLTAEPGFMGVAAGRGVSMWPPCKERQKTVSLGHASPCHSCAISSGNSTPQSGLPRARVEMGPGEDTAGDGESVHKALELLGERNRARKAMSRAVWKRPFGKEGFPLEPVLRSRIGREGAHQSFLGRPNKQSPHRPQTPLWEPCKEALQGAQGTERCQGHPARTHRLSLPESVHDGTPLLSHHTVVPQPGLGVDGLPHSPQHLQGLPAVPAERRGLPGAQQDMELSACCTAEPAGTPGLPKMDSPGTVHSFLNTLPQGERGVLGHFGTSHPTLMCKANVLKALGLALGLALTF